VTRMPLYTHIPELNGSLDLRLWEDPHAYEKGILDPQSI
jgi:hypothetical protein